MSPGAQGGRGVQVFRFLGPCVCRWYARPVLMGLAAIAAGGGGAYCLARVGGLVGLESGLLLLTTAVALCAFAWAALWFAPPVAEIAPDGQVTMRWPRRTVSFPVTEVLAVRWIRPSSWRDKPLRRLEHYRVELEDRALRVQADPGVFEAFARALEAANPRVVVSLPVRIADGQPAQEPG